MKHSIKYVDPTASTNYPWGLCKVGVRGPEVADEAPNTAVVLPVNSIKVDDYRLLAPHLMVQNANERPLNLASLESSILPLCNTRSLDDGYFSLHYFRSFSPVLIKVYLHSI